MTSPTSTITVFGADWCRDCVRTKNQLSSLGVKYDYVDLVTDPAAADVAREISGRTNIPVVVYPDSSHHVEPSNADVFITQPGPFIDLVVAAINDVTGRKPDLNTGGGTSDARFITHYCPVIEFGLVGQTMHQIDERTPVSDLEKLTRIYRGILDRYFA